MSSLEIIEKYIQIGKNPQEILATLQNPPKSKTTKKLLKIEDKSQLAAAQFVRDREKQKKRRAKKTLFPI